MLDLFRNHLIVGGLPDAVNAFLEQHNVMAIRKVQNDIYTLYRVDASKYEQNHARLKIQRIYGMIPSNLENKKKRVIAKNIENKMSSRMENYSDEFCILFLLALLLM